MNRNLVSVLIPTWNRREMLAKSLASIYQSTYQNIEIIVVDNGSVDGTGQFLAQQYPQVRVCRLEVNQGPVAARNAGLKCVRGDYVFFMDDDCAVNAQSIAKMVDTFERNLTAGAIVFKITDVNTGAVLTTNCPRETKQLWIGAAAIRKSVIERVGEFTKYAYSHGDEFDYSIRIWENNCKIIYEPALEVLDFALDRPKRISGSRVREIGSWLLVIAQNFSWQQAFMFSFRVIISYGLLALKNRRLTDYFRGIGKAIARYPEVVLHKRRLSQKTVEMYWDPNLLPDTFNVPLHKKFLARLKNGLAAVNRKTVVYL